MTTEPEFERRLTIDLQAELDRAVGPHRDWIGSPAAARVATGRGRIRWRGQVLAVAAVLVIAGGLAVALGSRPNGSTGCPTLADYAAASAAPTASFGEAPGVSFPPVAPDASATTGLLRPGTWAVIADDKGPVAQIRLRDVRDCGRLPDVRSGWVGGTLILATADIRVLRDDAALAWLGANDVFDLGLGGTDLGRSRITPNQSVSSFFGIPGVDRRQFLAVGAGFSNSSTIVFDVPPTDLEVDAYEASLRHGQDSPASLGVAWNLRSGRVGDLSSSPRPTPGATETTGELAPGSDATIKDPAGDLVVTLTDVDQVTAYPGRTPSPGNVFVEARIVAWIPVQHVDAVGTWRAVDGDGRELPILANADPNVLDAGVLQVLSPTTLSKDTWNGWLVVEAPGVGLVRLELTLTGEAQPRLSYVIRRP